MKKYTIIYIVFLCFFMTGCYSTVNVTSKDRFDNAISSTTGKLNQIGYRKTGAATGKNTEITRSEGFVYMPNVGVLPYSDEQKNETTIDNYFFVDSDGNTLNYSVAYELKESHDKIWYVDNANVVGCATGNPDKYESLCGDSSFIRQLNYLEKTDTVSIYSSDKTWGLVFALECLLLGALCVWGLSVL